MAAENAEGKVNWDGAADFFQGKGSAEAGAETPPENTESAANEIVEVSIRGRKVKMTREAATAFEEFRRETRERDGRLGGEIANLRERSARLEGMIETVRPAKTGADDTLKPPPPELAISDFAEWQRQMTAYNAGMMQMQRIEIEERYAADQSRRQGETAEQQRQRAWADRFYASNPDLNKPHLRGIVRDVYSEFGADINAYGDDVEGAHKRLAELANQRIVEIKQDGKVVEAETRNRPPHLEGAGAPTAKGAKPEPKHVPTTAAGWVAKHRAKLRGGSAK